MSSPLDAAAPGPSAADFCLVLTTLPDPEQAASLARALVSSGLAACVQIDPIRSIYRWQGQVQEEAEWRLSIKTRHSLYAPLEQWLREHHPYDTPEVVCLPIVDGSASYLHWVAESTRP
jgi:periplasmic divalent cation tolerance protein